MSLSHPCIKRRTRDKMWMEAKVKMQNTMHEQRLQFGLQLIAVLILYSLGFKYLVDPLLHTRL